MKTLILLITFFFISILSFGQTDSIKNQQINVFLDCSYYCDEPFIKEQIKYVNYV